MFVDWTKNLKTDEEKQHFEDRIRSSKDVLERLMQLLKERTDSIDMQTTTLKSFDSPNWANRRAFMDGFKSCSKIINKLIDLDQQKDSYYDRDTTGPKG
jgi:hypothetical protein